MIRSRTSLSILREEVLNSEGFGDFIPTNILEMIQTFIQENTEEVDQMIEENVFSYYDKEIYVADSISDIEKNHAQIIRRIIPELVEKYPDEVKTIIDKYELSTITSDKETMLDALLEICELPQMDSLYEEWLLDLDFIHFNDYEDSDWGSFDIE